MALTPAMDIAARRFWHPNGLMPRAGEAVCNNIHVVYNVCAIVLKSSLYSGGVRYFRLSVLSLSGATVDKGQMSVTRVYYTPDAIVLRPIAYNSEEERNHTAYWGAASMIVVTLSSQARLVYSPASLLLVCYSSAARLLRS